MFLDFLKIKLKRETKIAQFGGLPKFVQFKFEFFWRLFFEVKGRLQIFKIYSYQGPSDILKIACGQVHRFFGIVLTKIYIIGSAISLHPIGVTMVKFCVNVGISYFKLCNRNRRSEFS